MANTKSSRAVFIKNLAKTWTKESPDTLTKGEFTVKANPDKFVVYKNDEELLSREYGGQMIAAVKESIGESDKK